MYSHPFPSLYSANDNSKDNSREEHKTFGDSFFVELEKRECMKVVMDKTAKLFPTYLMNPANRKTFYPQNFCHLQYMEWSFVQLPFLLDAFYG